MTRRYGPTLGAGTVIEEKQADPSIQVASLGNTAYTGIFRKGPVGKIFRAATKTEFNKRAGSISTTGLLPESMAPYCSLAFFRRSKGAGALYVNRITDGSEKASVLEMYNRKPFKSTTLKLVAGNGGRWAGRKAHIVDNYNVATATTITLTTVPAGLKIDELEGARVTFAAIPGKSFEVLSNTEAGELQFDLDINLINEINGSTNKLISVKLENAGEALGARVTEATLNPTTDWKLEIWAIEGGIFSLLKTFDNLSSNPNAKNYYDRVINFDSDSDFTVKVEDLNSGTVSSATRPANYAGQSKTLTATVLSVEVTQAQANSVSFATAESTQSVLGGSVIKDSLTLTNTAAGARSTGLATFGANPSDGDTIDAFGTLLTFKTAVVNAATQILIGLNAEETIDNTVALINSLSTTKTHALYQQVFVVKASASTMAAYAQTAGAAGDNFTTAAGSGANPPTWGAATLTGGVDQTWSVASVKMPFLVMPALISGVAYAAVNDYGFGFTLIDTSRNAAKVFILGETITVEVLPLEVNSLAGGKLLPKSSVYRSKFDILSNTANSISVKTGSDMTTVAVAGDDFAVEYIQEFSGGYDGIAGITDAQYIVAYDPSNSPLRAMRGKNLGLVKLATPGVTSVAVQKAGVAFAGSQNWQYRGEIPSNIASESAAEEYVNVTLGRDLFLAVTYPTYAWVTNPDGAGLVLVSEVGEIHGAEADMAKNYQGFHKAAAGLEAKLPDIRKLPHNLGDKDEIDQELLNPQGIGQIQFKGGNFVIWGDRIPSDDPGFVFKHHRELLSHYENTLLENYDFVIYALNSSGGRLQARLISSFITYFTPELAKEAIVGDDVQDAIRLKIDNENNTDITRSAGDYYAELEPKLADTVERFIIRIGKRGVEESAA